MRRALPRPVAAALGVTLAAIGAACTTSAGTKSEAKLRSVTGPELLERIRASDARFTVVNVWATWCGPCREEFPYVQSVARSFADQGVDLIFVSADFDAERPATIHFLESQGADFPSYIKTGEDGAFIEAVAPDWSGAIPFTVVFDGGGERVHAWYGQVSETDLRSTLTRLVATSSG